jgi:hypothetical protein
VSTCLLLSAGSSHDDTDYRGRRYDPTVTDPQNLSTPRPKARQDGTRGRQFLFGGLPLDRQQLAARAEQPSRPASEPVERRDRSRRRDIRLDGTGEIFGTAPDNGGVRQIQRRHALFKENRTAEQRLEQHHVHFRPKHRKHHPWQPGPGPDVDEIAVVRQQLGDNRAVQQVPVPEAGRLARTDQAALHAVSREQFREPDGRVNRASEHLRSLGWRRRSGRHLANPL